MPETLFVNNFGAGWCPSDDPVNGRPNGLLQMDNLELDKNGALQLSGGTAKIWGPYSAYAHTLFSRYINNIRYDYAACNDGSVYRSGTSIATGGDQWNAAFGTAFNFVLICSGSKRFKDNGSTLVNLGVGAPTVAPTISVTNVNASTVIIGTYVSSLAIHAGSYVVISSSYIQCTTNVNGIFAVQTYPPPSTPIDCTQFSSVGCSGTATEDDFVIINGYAPSYKGMSIEFDVLLQGGDSSGDPPTDFYSFSIQDLSLDNNIFDSVTGAFTLNIKRSDFQVVGSGLYDWSKTYGFRLVVNNGQNATSMINIWGAIMGDNVFEFRGSTSAQFGTYQYMQVNVNDTGSYLAKSQMGPPSNPVVLNGVSAFITYQLPTDPQVNRVWIFRTGGNLGGIWYRVATVNAPFTGPYQVWDCSSDQYALELNIFYNVNLISIASTSIDKVFDIIGPIQGRWFYFTTNFMYPSEINDPDLVDPSIAVRICGSTSELFMWARAVSASVILVGTSVECYLLTGTFSTFPDGTVDIYYQSLGVKFPPITYDAVSYGGAVYYLGSDGWRMVLPTSFGTTYSSQNNQLLVVPNTDRLYRGETCYAYNPPNLQFRPGFTRFPVTIGRNKLWCFVEGTGRIEIYDFLRQYWHNTQYFLGDVSAATTTQDGKILAAFYNDKMLREVGTYPNKLIDGVTQQTFKAFLPYKDNGKPRQRKDTYTFKTKCWLSTGSMNLTIYDESSNAIHVSNPIIAPALSEQFLDLSTYYTPTGILPKSYLIELVGTSDEANIEDVSIDYDPRPIPLTFLRIYPNNLGSATQKRMRTWPLVIDTLGNTVVFTPSVDNVAYPPVTFISNYKKTLFYYFVSDAFGIDYGGTLQVLQPGEMEVWDTGMGGGAGGLNTNIVQNLPISTQFDQVGPVEVFRWGKVVRMGLRCFSQGSPIPFQVLMSDNDIWNSQFNVTPGVEDEYIVDLPKGTSGRIIRVTLGPTSFTFNRYYLKFQVAISGGQKDTELQWLTYPGLTSQLAGGI